jgi:hypothetical protein
MILGQGDAAVTSPNHDAVDDVLAGRLLQLWQKQLSRFEADSQPGGKTRISAFRREVLEHMQLPAAYACIRWVNQALALFGWRQFRDERGDSPTPVSDDNRLRDACRQLRTRIDAELRADRSRLIGLTPPKEWQELLADSAAILVKCEAALGRSPRNEPVAPVDISTESEEAAIDRLIESANHRWPPLRLCRYVEQLHEIDAAVAANVRSNLLHVLAESAESWRVELSKLLAVSSPSLIDCVILLRALLEAIIAARAPSAAISGIQLLARDLIAADQLAVELIRDAKQPAEWFLTETASIREPTVLRAGWALRGPHKPWVCFPPGKLALPVSRTPALDAIEKMQALVQSNGWLASVADPIEACQRVMESGSSVGADNATNRMLDAMLQAIAHEQQRADAASTQRKIPKPQTYALDQLLGHLRRWCGTYGLEVLPRKWTFSQFIQFDELQVDERECSYFFRPDEVRGCVYRVRTFGLKQGERLLWRPAVSVSAGKAPAGLQELDEVIKTAVDHGEEVLLERIRNWREAAFQGTLDMVVVQFYVDYWGDLGEELRTQHPDLAQEFSMRLFDLLKLEFRLFPFYPVAYQEHPDGWLQRVSGKSMITGRVRRIVRPGLQDEHGQLRLPALVEVE